MRAAKPAKVPVESIPVVHHRGQRAWARHRGWAVGAPSFWGTAWAWSSTPIPSTPTMIGGDGIS